MAIHYAALQGNIKVLDCLLTSFNANIHARTKYGLTVIHCAAQSYKGALSILYFAERGVSIDSTDNYNSTPLHFSVINKRYSNLETCLSLKANPNIQDSMGLTAVFVGLHKISEDRDIVATFDDYKMMIKELVFNGANKNITDNKMLKPIDFLESIKDQLDAQ